MAPYDVIICSLPFSNFPAELVDQILGVLLGLLQPDGELAFFEYTLLRPAQMHLPSRHSRRLRMVDEVVAAYGRRHQVARPMVLRNIPPATVLHLGPATRS